MSDNKNEKQNNNRQEIRKNRKRQAVRNRNVALATVLCFVGAIAFIGTYALRDYKSVKKQTEKFAQGEEQKDTEDAADSQETGGTATKGDPLVLNTSENPAADSVNEPATPEETKKNSPTNSADSSGAPSFNDDSTITRPVNGPVIQSFSMDKTVYFRTLDQYRYNPAMIMEAAEGEQVLCGADGTIKSIEEKAQTGTTVDVDLGGGYELIYGQLTDVSAKVGDHVEAKTVLGKVNKPTKYYSLEGANVYLEMRKDDVPVNPAEYLE